MPGCPDLAGGVGESRCEFGAAFTNTTRGKALSETIADPCGDLVGALEPGADVVDAWEHQNVDVFAVRAPFVGEALHNPNDCLGSIASGEFGGFVTELHLHVAEMSA